MKYAFLILSFLLFAGCSSTHNHTKNSPYLSDAESNEKKQEYIVLIADIEWVKLYRNEIPEPVKNSEGLWETTVSTGCGKAEIQYRTMSGEDLTVWMEMGEWCNNPFDYFHKSQLIVVDSKNNRLDEYYPIKKTDRNSKVIYFIELYQFEHSIFRDLVKPFDEPLYLFQTSDANDEWIGIMNKEGLIENYDNGIWALKGVYISDVIDQYHLKKE